jgi:hypothetical protein
MSSRDYLKHTVSITQPPRHGNLGDEWYHPTTNKLYKLTAGSGTTVQWLEILSQTTTTASNASPAVVTSLGTLSSLTVAGPMTITGLSTLQQSTEPTTTLTGATGVVTHNFLLGAVFHHTGPAASWTANFTNVPTTTNRVISIVLIVTQGGTAYIPNAVQIDGAAQTISWSASTVPTGNANKTDVFGFTLHRKADSSWSVYGSYGNYG